MSHFLKLDKNQINFINALLRLNSKRKQKHTGSYCIVSNVAGGGTEMYNAGGLWTAVAKCVHMSHHIVP